MLVVLRHLSRRARRPTPAALEEAVPFSRAALYTVAGGTVFGLAASGAWVLAQEKTTPDDKDVVCSCAERVRVFSAVSGQYDATVGRDEVVMGLPILRWWLLRRASGDVLEVAAGTGSNLKWYDMKKCNRITATDASRPMLEVAARKIKHKPWAHKVVLREVEVSSLGVEQFDTVVDTFGLCSFEDPVAALATLQRSCKPDGTLLLLEHGRSYYTPINNLLDKYAARHLRAWGCTWNRDIIKILQEAGLQVDSLTRFHFGTTYLIVARPRP
ncbi:hypothetical protein CTAYLR_009801 [Chrysophaeum taylorii]|uniref:Uncharacterized protein n=1 Tax=Chrysophaeum taylorii TaxID=2483200 RepID=A0AAD7XPU7_9STRA|nr:hypothetical protein CTAYLR_009801 [Chrysophaeum taylorii]